jgi:hypothetical protein
MAVESVDRTILVFHAYARQAIDVDETLEGLVESLGVKPLEIVTSSIYTPIAFSDLSGVEKSNIFTIDFNEEKCHVIRKWVVVFDGILPTLPILNGCVEYYFTSKFQLNGSAI